MPSFMMKWPRVARSLRASRGSGPAIGWSALCRICLRPSLPCWRPPASVQPGRPVLLISVSKECWIDSDRLNPKCSLRPTVIFSKEKSLDSLERISNILKELPSIEKVVVVPFTEKDPDITRHIECRSL